MSAEPLPTPGTAAARSRRAEGLSRAVLGRPVLALVPNPVRARRAPFVALVLGTLLVGLLGLLLLNTASAQDAFKLHRLQSSAADVADERQALSEDVNGLTGPAGLAQRATAMGMVPAGPPVFWKPGDPLPPGARVVGGLLVVPNATGKAAPTPTPSASVPDTAVKAVPRPGTSGTPSSSSSSKASKGSAPSAKASPSTKASSSTSTKASPSTTSSTKPSTAANSRAGARPTSTASRRASGTTSGTSGR
jgi:hypothetical protein